MKDRLLPAYQLGAIDSDVITSATFPACVLHHHHSTRRY
jgi:hypothetical protein